MSGQAPATLSSPFTTLKLETEDATRQLAEDLAVILRPGDAILLSGDLGAGKSTLSRALLRSLASDPELEVPSPTFTLVQTYRLDRLEVAHFDLYRLEEPEEVEELGLAEVLETGAALIEWPEMAADLLPENALWLQLTETGEVGPDGEAVRTAAFQSDNPDWQKRVQRTLGLRRFLIENDYSNAGRSHIAGDASARNFERIVLSKKSAILMDWPEPEGAAATPEALSYNALVHRAPDCRAFVAVAGELKRRGFGAAGVLASSVTNGMLLLEDLGSEGIVDDEGAPFPDRYHAAMRILARLHSEPLPQNVPLPDGGSYDVPDYSLNALLTEADLYVDWFAPDRLGRSVSDEHRRAFRALWTAAINDAQQAECSWVLRDVHSPNILWQQDKDGDDRIGLIDLQDTVWGPVAYDVASLALDARVDVSGELEKQLLMTYFDARQQANPGFDRVRFEAAYAIMAAQRLTKILGIFVRLAKRDGKPGYLVHAPRLIGYMDRVLQHPSLTGLKDWFGKSGLFLKRTGE
ncbi:7.5 kda chlorosome protein [Roseibium sp. TrichSKD4]|uniref:bifunctional tRNA (adenosine(37)-N6)-threonylcarbamoyltransferase complex ATPase subunit type 1 TsaE/phosphotransferase n=1 Tax=Roseibium sp. TrichSKD4 TaxID=744980 RepID=UPI0001E56766|nr:bifunctional tRNA (adenosine(37)-N6)-threonylcarbamoyltransferase complex ATPase subunit type 1 TsaE/phosphotransferase [Roseibium sp. TrichSKD4]EFO32851.1 7.5 kda chlorosome protein [Roseibium sp. TrichSKD4]